MGSVRGADGGGVRADWVIGSKPGRSIHFAYTAPANARLAILDNAPTVSGSDTQLVVASASVRNDLVSARFEPGDALAEVADSFSQEVYAAVQGADVGTDIGFQGTDVGAKPSGQCHHQGGQGTSRANYGSENRDQISVHEDTVPRRRVEQEWWVT